jgi:hypothetical protein
MSCWAHCTEATRERPSPETEQHRHNTIIIRPFVMLCAFGVGDALNGAMAPACPAASPTPLGWIPLTLLLLYNGIPLIESSMHSQNSPKEHAHVCECMRPDMSYAAAAKGSGLPRGRPRWLAAATKCGPHLRPNPCERLHKDRHHGQRRQQQQSSGAGGDFIRVPRVPLKGGIQGMERRRPLHCEGRGVWHLCRCSSPLLSLSVQIALVIGSGLTVLASALLSTFKGLLSTF